MGTGRQADIVEVSLFVVIEVPTLLRNLLNGHAFSFHLALVSALCCLFAHIPRHIS